MRRIIVLNRVSIDGFFAGLNGEIDWFVADPELDKVVREPTPGADKAGAQQMDTVLLGRVTYQMFESYWPKILTTPRASKVEIATANELTRMEKIVFSNTLKEVNWENTRVVKGNVAEEVRKLKQANGGGMIIFGSGTIISQLVNAGLIDEYMLIVTPVVLGAGKQMFSGVKKLSLEPTEARLFKSGNVLLRYIRKQSNDRKSTKTLSPHVEKLIS